MAKHTVPADTGHKATRAVDVILDDEIDDQFDVVPEDVKETEWPSTYEGAKIKWVNNFTVRKKSNVPKKSDSKLKYTIELDAVSGKWVYYDPSTSRDAQELTTRPAGNNRVQGDLFADDPGVGHT